MSTGKPAPPLPLQKPPGYRDPAVPIQHNPPRPKAVKLPPSFQQTKRRKRSCCRIFCCCICISIVILIFVLACTGGIFYLLYQPRLPQIQLKSIDFTKFNVSATSAGPVLDAQSNIAVVVKNPNQNFGIIYDRTKVSISAVNGDVNLGEQTVKGFVLGKSNVTTLRFETKVQKEALDGKSAEELKKGIKNKNLIMSAEIRSGIGVKQNQWKMNPVQVAVLCSGMRLNQLQGGGSTPKCRIKVLNWFYIN